MKSLKTLAVMATAVLAFSACGNSSAPKADLKTDVDSMSYAIGLLQSQYVRQAIEQGQVIDTTYMDDFVKGINEGVNAGDDKKKAAYIMGLQVGQQLSTQLVKGVNHEVFGDDSTKTISLKNLLAGFITGATGKKGLMTPESANTIAQTKMEQIKAKNMEKQFGANKAAGEKYLVEYKKGKDVKELKGGVLYKVIKEGTGAIPTDTSMVSVQYEGKTIDGKVFDSSYKSKEPVKLRANQVIPGWTEALTHMPVGSVWEVVIPQEKAYGAREQREIKPFSALIFKIELLGIEK